MKKLDRISKKEIFTVPEGYFDKLSLQIQDRVTLRNKTEYAFRFNSILKYALPVTFVLVMIGTWFYSAKDVQVNTESILAAISTEELVAYLNDSDLSTDDVLETVEFNNTDLDEIEESIYESTTDNESFKSYLNEID